MKLSSILLVLFLFVSSVAVSQVKLVLTTGDTLEGVHVRSEANLYILTKSDGTGSKLQKSMVAEVIQDFKNIGSKPSYIYCEIVGTQKFLSPKVTVSIDYGQETSFWTDTRIKDDMGNVQTFNSMVDALNYLGRFGWEFAQAYTISHGDSDVYHWLLRKKPE